MTGDDIPVDPSVLNTTVLSNFAYIDQLWVVTGLSGICTVPIVREELETALTVIRIFNWSGSVESPSSRSDQWERVGRGEARSY